MNKDDLIEDCVESHAIVVSEDGLKSKGVLAVRKKGSSFKEKLTKVKKGLLKAFKYIAYFFCFLAMILLFLGLLIVEPFRSFKSKFFN